MTLSIAFVGLGVMGFPMAGHLQNAGYPVTVFNRTASKAQRWVADYGGNTAPTPAAAASKADIVLTCVGNDDDLRHIVLGDDGILAGMRAGSLLVDHTTTSAELARALEKDLQAQGMDFLDAPVSGGQQGAQNGQLTIMCGGAPATFARARPVLACYARAVTHMGPTDAG